MNNVPDYRKLPIRVMAMRLLAAAVILAAVFALRLDAQAVSVSSKFETLTGGTWKKKTVEGTAKYRYKKTNGKYAKNGWKKIDGKWYCLNKSGYALTGMKKVNGKYYYFEKSGAAGAVGEMKTGLVENGGKSYFFRTTGSVGVLGSRVESEWVSVDGVDRYFKVNGVMHDARRMTEKEFIKKVGPLAKEDMKTTGILASVTIAQAILESGFGSSSLAMEANNFFGMKASLSGNAWESQWDGTTFSKNTLEWYSGKYVTVKAAFRSYADMAASIRDHSDYLRFAMNGKVLRYKGVVGNKSYKKTIKLIKNGGYATDPNYVNKVVALIKKYKLTKYDK